MFIKIIAKIANWSMKIVAKKQKEKKVSDIDKQKLQIYIQLQNLYKFVHWLNVKGLRSRRERKTFWRNVSNNQAVLENTLQNLIKQYTLEKNDKVKPLAEGIVNKGGINPKPSTPRPVNPPKGQNPIKERVKHERMGHIEKGARIGKPREKCYKGNDNGYNIGGEL